MSRRRKRSSRSRGRRKSRLANNIRDQVVHNIAVVSGFPDHEVTEEKRLFQDLGLAVESRRALAPGFEAIAHESNEAARVTRTECAQLLTVRGAIVLVTKKATPKPVSKKAITRRVVR